jgi:hypothetical protein
MAIDLDGFHPEAVEPSPRGGADELRRRVYHFRDEARS